MMVQKVAAEAGQVCKLQHVLELTTQTCRCFPQHPNISHSYSSDLLYTMTIVGEGQCPLICMADDASLGCRLRQREMHPGTKIPQGRQPASYRRAPETAALGRKLAGSFYLLRAPGSTESAAGGF
jgi:hypothetical protein